MNIEEFRKNAHDTVDFIADYFNSIEDYPVMSKIERNSVYTALPESIPENPEPYKEIMKDFNEIIMPGISHWQSPNFFAYFPANNSFPSILGEMLTAALGAQCMMWQTSPAAAELEEKVMEWLKGLCGLPQEFHGVIQDTASTATLCSILTAREKITDYNINENGYDNTVYRVYCSSEAHSSIEKDVKIAGIGRQNLVKIPVDDTFAMNPALLEEAVKKDIEKGIKPLCVVAALGTTGSTAIDPIDKIGRICKQYNIWLHVDAAYAGTAMILPEKQKYLKGIEYADTYVFNPHKWMFTNFDCSAYFVRDKETLIRTFEIMPEYLKTKDSEKVNNYRDWGIQLGRRFRALKLWFVLRSYGASGLRQKVQSHIDLTAAFVKTIEERPDFEILAPAPFATACFRYNPGSLNEEELNELNKSIMERVNNSGKIYISHTKLDGKYTIRFVIGQTNVNKRHVEEAWKIILREAHL